MNNRALVTGEDVLIGSHIAKSSNIQSTVGRPGDARIDDAACTPERQGVCRHYVWPLGHANSVFGCRRRVSSHGGLAQIFSWFAAHAATVVRCRI